PPRCTPGPSVLPVTGLRTSVAPQAASTRCRGTPSRYGTCSEGRPIPGASSPPPGGSGCPILRRFAQRAAPPMTISARSPPWPRCRRRSAGACAARSRCSAAPSRAAPEQGGPIPGRGASRSASDPAARQTHIHTRDRQGAISVKQINQLTLAEANLMLDAAQAKAEELGVSEVLCVSDAGGYPIALRRLDGGKVTSVEIAINKAFTAAGHRKPTHVYKNAVPGEEAFGIMTQHFGRFTIF